MNWLKTNLILLTTILFLIGCSEDKSIVDPVVPDSFPAFQSITLSSYAFDTDTISVSGQRSPDDPVQLLLKIKAGYKNSLKAKVKDAHAYIYRDGNSTRLAEIPIQDMNTPELYTFSGLLNIRRGDVGDYSVEVTGTDDRGYSLNSVITKFNVINGVNPPIINCVQAPDTLQAPSQGFLTFTLQVCVKDPSGQQDIRRVWFNTYDPNNKPNPNNPFIMYDDGTHGDAVANDGNYSLTVQLPSTTTKGKYRFEFQAFDFGNLGSNVEIKYIYII